MLASFLSSAAFCWWISAQLTLQIFTCCHTSLGFLMVIHVDVDCCFEEHFEFKMFNSKMFDLPSASSMNPCKVRTKNFYYLKIVHPLKVLRSIIVCSKHSDCLLFIFCVYFSVILPLSVKKKKIHGICDNLEALHFSLMSVLPRVLWPVAVQHVHLQIRLSTSCMQPLFGEWWSRINSISTVLFLYAFCCISTYQSEVTTVFPCSKSKNYSVEG